MAEPLRPGVTAVVVALNEERQLPTLFDSLRWCESVVVVDGGSHDRTPELCRAAGVVYRERRFDDFASQRNFAASLATTEWILSIDADERPTRSLVREIRAAIVAPRRAAYRIPIRSVVLGRAMRFGGTQDDLPIRLFRKSQGVWIGAVHERLTIDGSVGRLRAHLAHTTLPTLPVFLAKVNRYANLAAKNHAGRPAPTLLRSLAAPIVETARRLVWKGGALDGPEGWMFAALSGLAELVASQRRRSLR